MKYDHTLKCPECGDRRPVPFEIADRHGGVRECRACREGFHPEALLNSDEAPVRD